MALDSNEREELITNTCLFLRLYENTETEQKKTNILKCLVDGANINARDANNKSNTPAHIAVQIGDKEILQLLIEKGAKLNQKNSEGKTPHCLAVELNLKKTDENACLPVDTELAGLAQNLKISNEKYPAEIKQLKEIEDLLRTLSKNSHDADNILVANENSTSPFFYEKRTGTAGVRGQLYETKLLSLVLIRMLYDKDITTFLLGTNINQLGDLDDVCLRYEVKGHKPVILFLQAKHREKICEKGKLTVDDIKKEAGDFSLLKYFSSYLKIKEKFQTNSKDPMFVGEFDDVNCNFILYTPIKDNFSRKRNTMDQKSIKLNDIIRTNKGDFFQYDYDDEDITILTKSTVLHQLKLLAHQFLKYVMAGTKNSCYEKMASEAIITKYHVVLGREVIQVLQGSPQTSGSKTTLLHHTGKFRPEFFTSNSECIIWFRDFLYTEIISTSYCDKIQSAQNKVEDIIHELTKNICPSTISMAIGKIVTYNKNNKKLEFVKNRVIEKILEVKPDLKRSLNNINLDSNIINQACKIKLESIEFNLPTWFGNYDMTLRGNKSKMEQRLGTLSEKLVSFFKKHDTKIIKIDQSSVGQNKSLEHGIIQINGGIGGAVGNLLVRDEVTNMLKFDINNKNLPAKASAFLEELIKKISKEDLGSFRIIMNINNFPKYSFDGDDYDKRYARDYFDKLWFYTNQADESKVEHIVRQEINIHFNQVDMVSKNSFLFYNHAESIFLQAHDKIQKWWKRSGQVRYLDKTNNFFEESAKLLVFGSTMLVTLNFMYIKKIKMTEIEFDFETIKALELNNFSKGLVVIESDSNTCSGIKLMQYFEGTNSTFIDFDYVLKLSPNDFSDIMKELEFTSIQILLVIYDNSDDIYVNTDLSEKLKQIIDLFGGSTIILVTNSHTAKKFKKNIGFKYNSIIDHFDYANLTKYSQETILKETVYFQSEPMPFISILDKKARRFIRGGLLEDIIKGETKIRIGEGLWSKLEPGEEWGWVSYPWFYGCDTMQRFGATLNRGADSYYVKTLHDIKDNPVIVTSTSNIRIRLDMNIFGYLITNTKEIDRLPWIIRYQHSNYYWIADKNPTQLDSIKVIKTLMLTALTNEIDVDKLNLVENDGHIVLGNVDKLINEYEPTTIFDLELFIHFYNHNQIIFYFKINEIVQIIKPNNLYEDWARRRFVLIQALINRGKRVWVDYAQIEQPSEQILQERQMYEFEFGKPYILVGKHEYEQEPLQQSVPDFVKSRFYSINQESLTFQAT